MERLEAIKIIDELLEGTELVVCANGMICRERFITNDAPQNFYMLGSMGLTSSIGLGFALARPERKVVVIDGDGNLLMNLGSLAMIGDAKPENLFHIVLDNGRYGSTGGQRTVSSAVDFVGLARNSGYGAAKKATTPEELKAGLAKILKSPGPAFLWVRVSGENIPGIPRVSKSPEEIKRLIRESLQLND